MMKKIMNSNMDRTPIKGKGAGSFKIEGGFIKF